MSGNKCIYFAHKIRRLFLIILQAKCSAFGLQTIWECSTFGESVETMLMEFKITEDCKKYGNILNLFQIKMLFHAEVRL